MKIKIFDLLISFLKNVFTIEKTTTTASTTTTTAIITTSTTTSTTKMPDGKNIQIKDSTIFHLLEWEHKTYKAYDDGFKFMTIGVGHVIFDRNETFNNKKLISATLTDNEVNDLLIQDLKERVKAIEQIKNKIKVDLNQDQIDSLVLFIFNTGTLWNDLAKVINEKLDIESQFRKYITVKGKPTAGLINRREAEKDLYFSKYKGRNYYTKAKTVQGKIINQYY